MHFPYSTQPSHNSHLTHQTYLYIYIYTYMYTFPAEFQHHTFSSTQQNQCLYLYLHLYTGSTVKPQPLCVQGTQSPKNQMGWKCWPHFHPIWFLSFHYQRAHFYPDVLLLRYAWMQIRTWDHVFLFALLHTSQQEDRQNVKTSLRLFGTIIFEIKNFFVGPHFWLFFVRQDVLQDQSVLPDQMFISLELLVSL